MEEATSKHRSTIKVSGHRKTRGLSGNQGLLRLLQMVTTKDPRPKLARVVVDWKLTLREELQTCWPSLPWEPHQELVADGGKHVRDYAG